MPPRKRRRQEVVLDTSNFDPSYLQSLTLKQLHVRCTLVNVSSSGSKESLVSSLVGHYVEKIAPCGIYAPLMAIIRRPSHLAAARADVAATDAQIAALVELRESQVARVKLCEEEDAKNRDSMRVEYETKKVFFPGTTPMVDAHLHGHARWQEALYRTRRQAKYGDDYASSGGDTDDDDLRPSLQTLTLTANLDDNIFRIILCFTPRFHRSIMFSVCRCWNSCLLKVMPTVTYRRHRFVVIGRTQAHSNTAEMFIKKANKSEWKQSSKVGEEEWTLPKLKSNMTFLFAGVMTNGDIVVIGRENEDGILSHYDSQKNKWSTRTTRDLFQTMGTNQRCFYSSSAFCLDRNKGVLYSIGGKNSSSICERRQQGSWIHIYPSHANLCIDITRMQAKSVPPIILPDDQRLDIMYASSCMVTQTWLAVIGGCYSAFEGGSMQPNGGVFMFDIPRQTWSQPSKQSNPNPTLSPTVFPLRGQVFVLGGQTFHHGHYNAECTKHFSLFDGRTATWRSLVKCPLPIAFASPFINRHQNAQSNVGMLSFVGGLHQANTNHDHGSRFIFQYCVRTNAWMGFYRNSQGVLQEDQKLLDALPSPGMYRGNVLLVPE